jgi:hypothetical protein
LKISTADLENTAGFDRQAGTHWMFSDNRQTGDGRAIHVSLHHESMDNGEVTFNSVTIRAENWPKGIGFRVKDNGELVMGGASQQTYGTLSRRDQDLVNQLRDETQAVFLQSAILNGPRSSPPRVQGGGPQRRQRLRHRKNPY